MAKEIEQNDFDTISALCRTDRLYQYRAVRISLITSHFVRHLALRQWRFWPR